MTPLSLKSLIAACFLMASADPGAAQTGDVQAGDVQAGDVQAGDVQAGDVRAGDVRAGDASIILTFETGAETGAVMVALFDSLTDYDDGRPVRVAMIAATSGPVVSTTFDRLPAGDYAVRAFHDVNGDGQMNTNPFGMPVEPYAFSNNAVGNMGPASWDRARFVVSGETRQTIRIH